MVALRAKGLGCRGLPPPLLARQGGGLGLCVFLPGGGRYGGRVEWGPRLHSGGISSVYVLPFLTLLSGVTRRKGLGAGELQGFALCLVRSVGLVELGLALPLQQDLQPTVWALALEAVLDWALASDPVARLVVS